MLVDSIYLSKFITLAIILTLAIFSPGPDFALIMKNSLIYSKIKGFFTIFGILTGSLIHILYNILGISLISKNKIFFKLISIIGGSYIFYLGLLSIKSAFFAFKNSKIKPDIDDNSNLKFKTISNSSAFKMGFLTNILNPKAILFFLSIFTNIIGKETPLFILPFFVIEYLIIGFLCFGTIAIIFSKNAVRRIFYKYIYIVELITGLLFLTIGFKLIFFN